uniref:Uncharacterized protein n=1 Tax=Leersia perrieri TaxID=77586 RepID=A0A0D9VV61_9ORYZ
MGRKPCCSKEDSLNRGAWTAAEDELLASYIAKNGEGKWGSLPKRAGLKRCGKSCRLRWLNYLRPGIKRGNISADEEDLILRLHTLLGNRQLKFVDIYADAGRLPGRTDNEIKNYWNSTLSKRLLTNNNSSSASPAATSSDAAAAARRRRSPEPNTVIVSPRPIRTKAIRWCSSGNRAVQQQQQAGSSDHNGRPLGEEEQAAPPQQREYDCDEMPPAVCVDDLGLDDMIDLGLDGFLISPWRGGGYDYELGGCGGEDGAADLDALLGEDDGEQQQEEGDVASLLGDDYDYLELSPCVFRRSSQHEEDHIIGLVAEELLTQSDDHFLNLIVQIGMEQNGTNLNKPH